MTDKNKECEIEGCDKKHIARGYCIKHYTRFTRYGSPHINLYDRDIKERLDENYIPVPESGCWLWTASVLHFGYGGISVGGKTMRAHRLSYQVYKGKIPNGLKVLHKCDTPLCINPDHLYLGTHEDNMRDMRIRNRTNGAKGEDHPDAKLTAKQAWYAYILGKSGIPSIKIATAYRVHPNIIRRVVSGESYRDAVISFLEGEIDG